MTQRLSAIHPTIKHLQLYLRMFFGASPATAGRGGEPFGLSSPHPGRAVTAAPGRPAAVVPKFFWSQDGVAPATPACAIRTRPIASQAPPSRGWHVALHHPAPLQTLTSRIETLVPGKSDANRKVGKQNKPFLFTDVKKSKARKHNRSKMFTNGGLGVSSLPFLTETTDTFHVRFRGK